MVDDRHTRRSFLKGAGVTLLAGLAGCTSPVGSQRNGAETATETATRTPNSSDVPADAPYVDVYREVIDSVVLVRSFTPAGVGGGSGFVYRKGGYLLTNQHVVANANQIEIRFSRGEWRTASVVGTDVYSDLAVLTVDDPPAYTRPLPLVQNDPPVGTRVVAIGNPFGFSKSVSAGIISGVNRAIPVQGGSFQSGGFSIPDAVQTDAAVNPGNSGGPLVTLDGTVVGIIRSGGGENIGFAVSAALIRRVAPELIEDGEYEHSYMGVSLVTVTPTIAEANDLDKPRGVLVVTVEDGGPSDGVLQPSPGTEVVNGVSVWTGGDVIVSMGGERIDSLNDLSTFLALETSPGETIEVTVIRDGTRQTVDLTLGARPPPGTVG